MNKILFVDDDQGILDGIKRLLYDQKNNFEMTFLTSVEDAMRNCLVNDYDAIVSDVSMPGKTGFDLLQNLKENDQTKDIPIVIMTGSDDRELKKRALLLGAADLLSKPVPREDLLARLQNCIQLKTYVDKINEHKNLLERRVKERTRELEDTRIQVIRRLGRAGEFKDNETGMHVVRMSKYSAALGEKIGMGARECNLLLDAAPMHDIGKIGIPDRVLLKPGKLDPEEWKLMKTHVDIGVDILSGDDSEILKTARVIAEHHHEKWDGSGYPKGLKGTEISIEGRIVAICDVFDALTSKRPYKEPWSVEEATKFVEDQKGKHFDPTLIDHFMKILPDILEIKTVFSDDCEVKGFNTL